MGFSRFVATPWGDYMVSHGLPWDPNNTFCKGIL